MRESAAPDQPTARASEPWIAAAIVGLAMLRVFVFASAFPFFNNVDEHVHFDLVHKYARGFLPGAGEARFDRQSAELIVDWGSYEYNRKPESSGDAAFPLPFGLRGDDEAERAQRQLAVNFFRQKSNFESDGPPVYYWTAARWWQLGGALGLAGLERLYWLRWLNVISVGALVAGSYLLLRRCYPERALMRLGVPLLLALYPNDFQYGINSDALSPLLGAACFCALVRLDQAGRRSELLCIATGLLLAAAMLTKYTNLALVVLAGVATLGWFLPALRDRAARSGLGGLAWLWAAALLPFALWLLRNQRVMGDPTGSARKLKALGWSYKPIAEIPSHPIFGPQGWRAFFGDLFSNFWGGEIAWNGQVMHTPALDAFFTASSILCLVLAAAFALRRPRSSGDRAERFAAVAVGAAIATLVALSVLFEFNVIYGPSRAFPYFTSGRLIAGVLLPFMLLYVRGIERLCQALPATLQQPAAWTLLIAIAVLVSLSEISLRASVFASPLNWYHAG